jgi:hypothetical protein
MDLRLSNVTLASQNSYYLKNWPCGFGSALCIVLENIFYFNKYNITIFPMWNNNSVHFKYSDGYNNCFNYFFDDNKQSLLESSDNLPVIYPDVPILWGQPYSTSLDEHSVICSIFRDRFKLKDFLYTKANNILKRSTFTFSLHLRSNAQKRYHNLSGILDIKNILIKLQTKYGKDAVPFIATDVTSYLDICLEYFPNAIFNPNCFRVKTDNLDSVPEMTDASVKYGEEILIDLIGLSRGETIYMSESNILALLYIICNKTASSIVRLENFL